MSTHLAAEIKKDAKPKAMLRIAVPSFNLGSAKAKIMERFSDAPTKEEFQDIFHSELKRPVDAISLSENERCEYERVLDLRNALYTD